jgi:hypothetical protein
MPGLKCTKMECTGVWASGTTYVTFEDVKVPACNLIGTEGDAFKCTSLARVFFSIIFSFRRPVPVFSSVPLLNPT